LKESSLVKKLVKQGKLEQAIKMAEFNLEKDPSKVKFAKELTYARKAFVEKNKHKQIKELYSIKERPDIDKFVVKMENWEKWFPRDEVVNLALGLGYFKIKNYAAAIKHISKGLLLSPRFCEKKEVKGAIVEMLTDKRQWVRARALDLVKEAYLKTPLKEIKFLLQVVNDNQLDVDTRFGAYNFLHRRGFDDGINYNKFWRKQLRWSTSCEVRAKAANWFKKNGTKEDLSFLEVRVKNRSFRTGSGKKVSTSCYRSDLEKAVRTIKRRKGKNKSK
jgi:tetratricopeptide (TPR) repeat protein